MPLEQVRTLRDEIDRRVRELVDDLDRSAMTVQEGER
jgi:hypothetical protein